MDLVSQIFRYISMSSYHIYVVYFPMFPFEVSVIYFSISILFCILLSTVASHCFIFVYHFYFVLFHQLKDEEDLVEESQDIMTFMTAKSQNLIDLEDNEVIEENEHLELQNSHSELGNVKERPGELISTDLKESPGMQENGQATDVNDEEEDEEELKAIAEEAERRYREEGEPDLGDVYEQYEDRDEDEEYDEDEVEEEEADIDYTDDEHVDFANSGNTHQLLCASHTSKGLGR